MDDVLVIEGQDSVAVSLVEDTCGFHALRAIYDSGGTAVSVTDEEIMDALRILGQEGICVEPASATSVAVALKMIDQGLIERDERVVCVVTAAGIKWPNVIENMVEAPIVIEPCIEKLKEIIDLQ